MKKYWLGFLTSLSIISILLNIALIYILHKILTDPDIIIKEFLKSIFG